ncbi:VOC family protein [Tsuneonella sp. HG222]
MEKMIFVNLPVADLGKSRAFYEALGFVNQPNFTDETAACMKWSDAIYVMLLTHPKWQGFTAKAIPDGFKSAQHMLALVLEDRAAVDRLVEAGAAAGGAVDTSEPQDHGFMYQRTLEDPDGNIWEPFWMDPKFASGEAAPQPGAA